MEIYRHTEGHEDPELIEIEASALVRELLVAESDDGDQIWIEERDEPVVLDITIEEAGIRHRHHVHHGRCREVDVQIRFNGERISRDCRQLATVKHVFDWATGDDGYKLTPEQKAKHVLALPGADHFLDWNVRVGSLVTTDTCEVVLDLLTKERFEG